MDVDLLRPGTAPISPDTVLWFEFLLDPHLLKKYLCKPTPDPSATELIIKFLSVVPEPQSADLNRPIDLENPASPLPPPPEPEKYSRKHLALKILALKISAHLKWNLDIIEAKLPPQSQAQLVQDLVYMASDGAFSIPSQDMPTEMMQEKSVKFALITYYRWLLRFTVNAALQAKPSKIPFVHVPGMPPDNGYSLMNPHYEKILRHAESQRLYCVQFLCDVVDNLASYSSQVRQELRNKIKVPVLETFVHLTEDSTDIKHDWDAGDSYMSESELAMQVNYDLCCNYFFYGQYEQAKKRILLCKVSMDQLQKEYNSSIPWGYLNYASVSKSDILGYIRALNLGPNLLGEPSSSLQDLQESISNDYTGIITVLQADNLKREIPLVYRQVVELDIQASVSSGIFTVAKDLMNKVVALNAVRAVLEGEIPSTQTEFNNKLKTVGIKFVDILFWAFAPVLSDDNLTDEEWERIRNFFLHLSTSPYHFPVYKIDEFLMEHLGKKATYVKDKIFSVDHLNLLIENLKAKDDEHLELPRELLTTDWDTPDFNVKTVPELEIGCFKQRLIDASTADDIRKCLVNLAVTNPSKPLWKVNPQWQLPIPLQNVVTSLPRGFLQDFSYILLGKAGQFAEIGDHKAALYLLNILETETRNQLKKTASGSSPNTNVYKLSKLVGWESLFMQITQLLAEWPNHKINLQNLVSKCKLCIMSVQSGDSVIPRIQIVEACALCLLCCGEWDALGTVTGGAQTELAGRAAAACLHLHRHKGTKKMPREYWDLVLPVFGNGSMSGTKRNNTGNSVYSGSRTDGTQSQTKSRENLLLFFTKLREPLVITVTCSLLARIFNILNDDSNLDLQIDYINLWPSLIANSNSYNVSTVSEALTSLLVQALKFYPNNISWIKLLADINLANGNYAASLRHYLCVLTIVSDYFVQPLSKQLIEDQSIFKKMIKCCTQMNCHTQAAILCQFLDEIDYVLAFKCLSEKSHLCSDAMDSYYGCIWDTTILEFLINLHHKRGETHRKQLAIKVMGMLELNSNNNEEIQREAANSRKAKFMRSLVKQYVC